MKLGGLRTLKMKMADFDGSYTDLEVDYMEPTTKSRVEFMLASQHIDLGTAEGLRDAAALQHHAALDIIHAVRGIEHGDADLRTVLDEYGMDITRRVAAVVFGQGRQFADELEKSEAE